MLQNVQGSNLQMEELASRKGKREMKDYFVFASKCVCYNVFECVVMCVFCNIYFHVFSLFIFIVILKIKK